MTGSPTTLLALALVLLFAASCAAANLCDSAELRRAPDDVLVDDTFGDSQCGAHVCQFACE